MRTALLVISLVGILILAIVFGAYSWWRMADVQIGIHGLIALILGAVVSLLLGGGLMALIFYSHRHGHDDGPHHPLD
jgi:hypothetical protein